MDNKEMVATYVFYYIQVSHVLITFIAYVVSDDLEWTTQ